MKKKQQHLSAAWVWLFMVLLNIQSNVMFYEHEDKVMLMDSVLDSDWFDTDAS